MLDIFNPDGNSTEMWWNSEIFYWQHEYINSRLISNLNSWSF